MLLKHLKIRMNPMQYGYEDYAVSIFQNLQTFEDIKISQINQ
jgi:translation elongation factor P/translation initiation factor 5A